MYVDQFYNCIFSSFWYCSVDVSTFGHQVVTGDNIGNVVMLDMKGDKVIKQLSIIIYLSFDYHESG